MKIMLSMADSYVSHWGVDEALRELFKNAIDQTTETGVSFRYEYFPEFEGLEIESFDTVLDKSTLLLGKTDKAGEDKFVGKYGEGYKLALLVLAKNGRDVVIMNGVDKWVPKIMKSRNFGGGVLTIEIIKDLYGNGSSLVFIIKGITPEDWERYREKNLHLQKEYSKEDTPLGEVLLEERHRGKIFVEGLYVCRTAEDFWYGYNFKAGVIPLDRDRQKVSSIDIAWETGKMWFHLRKEHNEKLIEMIEKGVTDVEYLTNANDKVVKIIAEDLMQKFAEEHPGFVPVAYESDADELKKKYLDIKTRVMRYKAAEIMKRSSLYREILEGKQERKIETPEQVLVRFHDDHRDLFPQALTAAYADEVLTVSKNWTIG